ncbi:MAG: Ig-like domain-containing protein, partial [Chloroflexota bacterium]
MRKKAIYNAFALTIVLFLALAACRRDEQDATTPTVAPTSAEPANTPTRAAQATSTTTASAPPEATAEPEIEPIRMDPADIDWAPQVVDISPEAGEESLLSGAITIRFDQAMDADSVESAFAIEDAENEQAVAGAFEWPRADTLIYTPQSRLQRSQRYEVQIGETARSQNGQAVENAFNYTFQTVGFLEVAQVIPGEGVDGVDPESGITVLFNRPVVPLVGTAQQADLPQPLEIDPPVEGSGQWVSTSIYRFTPEDGFAGATEYDVTVPAGLEDVTGGLLEDSFTWQFSTAQPSVAAIEPSNGATRVAPNEPITVTFNMRMDQASVEDAISLEPSHAVEFEWLEDGRVLSLQPDDNFQMETDYTLTVGDSAAAASGQATLARETSSTFTTMPFPAVANTSPSPGEEAPAQQFGVNIEFVSPMDRETLEGRIEIDPAPEGEVDAFISPDGQFVNLTFRLEQNADYTITIPGDVADPYGNTLGDAYSWSFTTSSLASLASLNLPPNISQLSDDSPSDVTLIQRNVSSVDVALYELGLPTELLLEPGRVSEFTPFDDAIRTWNFEPDAPQDAVEENTINLSGGDGALATGVYYLAVNSADVSEDTRWWQNQRAIV